jgi:prepilin-type N-terminal cleavage/methylation domain-containing protein
MLRKNGFTLIEVVIVILVLGICLAPFAVLVRNVMIKNTYSQAHATAVALAEGEMERVTNARFSAVADQAATAFSAPFAAYTSQIIADYVNANALNTPVGGPTDYKRVQIVVANTLIGSVTLTTVVENDW